MPLGEEDGGGQANKQTQKKKKMNKKKNMRLLCCWGILFRAVTLKCFRQRCGKAPAWRRKGEQSCLCQPNNCRLGAATPRPSKHRGAAARADKSLRLLLMVSVRKQETAAVRFLFIFHVGEGSREDSDHRKKKKKRNRSQVMECRWKVQQISNLVQKGFRKGLRTVEVEEVTFRE